MVFVSPRWDKHKRLYKETMKFSHKYIYYKNKDAIKKHDMLQKQKSKQNKKNGPF